MLKLNSLTKKNIEEKTGISTDRISKITPCVFNRYLSRRIGKKIEVSSSSDKRLTGRGSVYIALNRIMKTSEIDKKFYK